MASATPKLDAKLQEDYAKRAVALMRQANEKGFKNVQTLKESKDFDALRNRDDFKELARALEKP